MKNKKRLIFKEDIDPKAIANANALLLINSLKGNPKFMGMLNQINLPTDKFKAITEFAELLGITRERFIDFVNQQNDVTKTETVHTFIKKIVREELKRIR